MQITIPDEQVQEILTGLQANRKSASRFIAGLIERDLREAEAVNVALSRKVLDKAELEHLSNTLTPGYKRFRVLCVLGEMEAWDRLR